MKHKLGEQWIEELSDGKFHMLKAIENPSNSENNCNGCCFLEVKGGCNWCNYDFNCDSFIIKDLGIVNDDGLLPEPFLGKYYPSLQTNPSSVRPYRYYIENVGGIPDWLVINTRWCSSL